MSALDKFLNEYELFLQKDLADKAAFTALDGFRAELARLRRIAMTLEAVRELARTSLAPDALNMTPERYAEHRLNRIASMADAALKEGAE